MFTLYLRDIMPPNFMKPFMEYEWFNGVPAIVVRNVTKMEFNEFRGMFDIFFELNGSVREFSLDIKCANTILAIYPEGN